MCVMVTSIVTVASMKTRLYAMRVSMQAAKIKDTLGKHTLTFLHLSSVRFRNYPFPKTIKAVIAFSCNAWSKHSQNEAFTPLLTLQPKRLTDVILFSV